MVIVVRFFLLNLFHRNSRYRKNLDWHATDTENSIAISINICKEYVCHSSVELIAWLYNGENVYLVSVKCAYAQVGNIVIQVDKHDALYQCMSCM